MVTTYLCFMMCTNCKFLTKRSVPYNGDCHFNIFYSILLYFYQNNSRCMTG